MKRSILLFGLAGFLLLALSGCGKEVVYPTSEHEIPAAVMTEAANKGIVVTPTPAEPEKKEETPAEPTLTPTPEYTPTPKPTEPPGTTFTPAPTKAPVDSAITTQYNNNRSRIESTENTVSEGKTLPCINIVTLNETGIPDKNYVSAYVDVFNCDSSEQLSAAAQVKIRGNSTAEGSDTKPYRIKFEKKQSMLGLHDGKKYRSWVLLRTYWDFAPDYLAFRMGSVILGEDYYVSDACYVNVYVDGNYKGIYLLCEQTQAADGRIDVNEPKNGDTSVRVGYMLEINNYAWSEDNPYFTMNYGGYSVTDISGTTKELSARPVSVDSDCYSSAQTDFIKKFTVNAFEILYQACVNEKAMKFNDDYDLTEAEDMTPQEAVEKVIDTDSLARMLILEELCHDYDVGEGSFYMCVDFSDDAIYDRLTFMAPWDFDWAYMGDADGGYYACTHQTNPIGDNRSNSWFIVAMKAEWFRDIVTERWNTLIDSGELVAAIEQVREDINAAEPDITSVTEGSAGSGRALCNYVLKRIDWLNTKWR